MLKRLFTTILFNTLLLSSPVLANDFYGVYEFNDKDFTDKKANQKIEYILMEDAPVIIFHGVESAGEGCCAYFKYNADNIKIDKKGNISFEIGVRDLFFDRKMIGKKSNDGKSGSILKFKGKFDKNSVTVKCSSDLQYDCYITKPMTFKKIKSLKY
ncbi:MAG: hypothetical protein U0354_01595 [Candidatus Sericytochromatia bacterium]